MITKPVRFAIPAVFAFLAMVPGPARARVTAMNLTTVGQPFFDGRTFGAVGPYEKLAGTITGELDPADPRNALITDIALAPRTPRGTVAYTTPIYLLVPKNPAAGRHALLVEAPNRGNKVVMIQFNTFGGVNNHIGTPNDPFSAADAGDGWMMRQGYTLAWVGWEGLVAPGANRMSITLPVARPPAGGTVTGRALDEFVVGVGGVTTRAPAYAAADPSDRTENTLTMRERYADPPIPVSGWSFASPTQVRFPPGTAMNPGWLYELSYKPVAPPVMGIGFAAMRDAVAFLRHGEGGLQSPLGHDIKATFGVGFSQSARFLRDFVRLGFNASEDGGKVFDGLYLHEAGANGVFLNARFAEPGETERQHTDRWYPEGRFPFAWNDTVDPVSGARAGALSRCAASRACPRIIESLSANEYWEKAGSLLTTHPDGMADLPDAAGVRSYLFSSTPHSAGAGPGQCAQPRNPLNANAGERALFAALDAWVRGGQPPPPSQVPRLADNTLAPPTSRAAVNFPAIPGVTYNGIATIRNARDWGEAFGPDGGVMTVIPPRLIGAKSPAATEGPGIYPSYVPTTDDDGNDVAGIRLPDVAVPVATFTGWGLAGPGQAVGDGCGPSGQMLAFPLTQAAAAAAGDPRRSIAERYPTQAAYVAAITSAALALQARRLLLPEDAAMYIDLAKTSTAGTGSATPPQPLAE